MEHYGVGIICHPARCCLPESIETVTVVRGGLESGRTSQTFAGYKLFVTAGRVIP